MGELLSEMSENPSARAERYGAVFDAVTAEDVAEEMAGLMRRAAEPARPGERVAEQILRAARRLGIDAGRGKRLWYAEARNIPAHEADTIRVRWKRLATQIAAADADLARLRMLLESGGDAVQ